uniref:Uncharacterized protein n=1 Tax=Oryza sativa subsp. japonica TaxID=39947 RepID=Q6K4F6_ORYSJ|nr:hypothetical protein [Oryza sativa Japonica Group]
MASSTYERQSRARLLWQPGIPPGSQPIPWEKGPRGKLSRRAPPRLLLRRDGHRRDSSSGEKAGATTTKRRADSAGTRLQAGGDRGDPRQRDSPAEEALRRRSASSSSLRDARRWLPG